MSVLVTAFILRLAGAMWGISLLRRLNDRRTVLLQVILALSVLAVPASWMLGSESPPLFSEVILVGLVGTMVLLLPERRPRLRHLMAVVAGASGVLMLPLVEERFSPAVMGSDGSGPGLQVLVVSLVMLLLVGMLDQVIDVRLAAEDEFRRALKRVEETDRLKSEFLGNVSHELRTPMNGILGMAELLLDTELDPEQREYAEAIRASGGHLLAIIDDLLTLSGAESGKISLKPTPMDLRVAVEEAVSVFRGEARRKGLELRVRFASSVPRRVVGDAVRIRQVLVNLVGNALKFTPRGHVLVRVDGRQLPGGRAEVTIAVEDTGIGISQNKQETVFERFTQADGSLTRKYDGMGLGLAISRELARLMGGDITVTSRPGRGSTFWFRLCLPVAEASLTVPGEQATSRA